MSEQTADTSQELMVDFITSLDGYGTAEGWPGWWGLEGPEYLGWLEGQPESGFIALMGSKTYELMSGMAQSARADDFSDEETESITGLAAADKVVISSTLKPPYAWPNTTVLSGDVVELVSELKRNATKPIHTLGSVSLCRSLMAAGLVDRFRVVIFPVITGRTGRNRIYDGYEDFALELVESRTFDDRSQLLEYVPRLLDAPLER
jgi:dihydrofolate reductase